MYCAFSIKYSKAHYLKAICLTSQNDWPPYTLSWSLSLKLWMLFICIMFIVHFSALFKFFCPGGHGPSPLQGSMDQVQNAGSMGTYVLSPHIAPLPFLPPFTKIVWFHAGELQSSHNKTYMDSFFKKIIVFPFSHLIHLCMYQTVSSFSAPLTFFRPSEVVFSRLYESPGFSVIL